MSGVLPRVADGPQPRRASQQEERSHTVSVRCFLLLRVKKRLTPKLSLRLDVEIENWIGRDERAVGKDSSGR
jgi:hypothetical protein